VNFTSFLHRAVLLGVALLATTSGAGAQTVSSPTAGSKAENTASLSYQDAVGNRYSTTSNTVVTTFAAVGAILVSPKQAQVNPSTDGFSVGSNVTRIFTIANVSNVADAYTVTRVTAAPAKILSVAFLTSGGPIPVALASTVSPTVQPGGSITVQVVASTAGVAIGTAFTVSITAQTTATGTTDGLQSDAGEQWAVAAPGAQLSGPSGPNTQVVKMVNQVASVQSNPQASVTFDIEAKNFGGSTATNVIVTDPVPSGLQPNLGSVTIDGVAAGSSASLTAQTITVTIPTLAAGAVLNVSFTATVTGTAIVGATFTNVASLAADGIAPVATSPASVLVGTTNVVFNPANDNRPVGGAIVTLLDSNGVPVKLMAPSVASMHRSAAVGPNTENPYTTEADGIYSFALSQNQIAPGGSHFVITVTDPGFTNRKIGLLITPGTDGLLYNVSASSLDNQPIALAGGYSLTSQGVELADVFGLFGNIPLFPTHTIVVNKTVDKPVAQPGDRLVYNITFGNSSSAALGQTQIIDTLPPGEVYARGTAQVDGVPSDPVVSGRTLLWTLPALAAAAQHTIMYATVVFPSVSAGTVLVNAVSVGAQLGGANITASATSDVQVIAGVFSQRGIITGRVFIDAYRSERFERGDRGVAGVRIYLENGSSVVTDNAGRYSFPGVRPGMHVLRLDTSTLPSGVRPFSHARMNSSWATQRLVHGIFDDGLIEDVNFGLAGAP